jgi:NAD-dependent DNA ligase
MATSVLQVKGIGPAAEKILAKAGITTAENLAAATPEALSAIPGFGESRARQVIANAKQAVAGGDKDVPIAVSTDAAAVVKPKKVKKPKKKTKTDKKNKKKAGKKKSSKDKPKKAKAKKEKPKKVKGKKAKKKK